MRAEKLLNQEDRIKFILNGKTFYYTREELRAFYDEVYRNSGVYDDYGLDDDDFERLIADLEQYDGDPYGHIENPNARKQLHEMLGMGLVLIIS